MPSRKFSRYSHLKKFIHTNFPLKKCIRGAKR